MSWGGPISSAISGAFALAGSKLEFEQNKQLAAQQNQYNIDMWKMQADYNSPAAQMERFKEAGLNPYLVASQGSAGNMQSAPEQVVPKGMEISKHMKELASAFNIEGLKTIIANRKKAQADARRADYEADNALVDMNRNSDEYHSETMFNQNYKYDIASGSYVYSPVYEDNPVSEWSLRRVYNRVMPKNYLLPYKSDLLSAQRSYLSPQIWMANYEKEHYPITYWVGTAGKGAKAVSDITGIFSPSRYLMPLTNKTRGFITPTGRVLNY